jgi:hypothetical protein
MGLVAIVNCHLELVDRLIRQVVDCSFPRLCVRSGEEEDEGRFFGKLNADSVFHLRRERREGLEGLNSVLTEAKAKYMTRADPDQISS